MGLLAVALFGLLVPNGYFVYWLMTGDHGIASIVNNHLALGFILDALLALVLLAWHYARHPIGRVRWPWFVVLSLIGGLGFSLPFYWWLNRRKPG